MFEGATIGQYKLLKKIGEGGMGAVFLAEHSLVGRRAAIKVLLPELSMRRDIVERFFNEARAMTQVNDPGIVQMYDFGFNSDGAAFIVMELLEGETLDHRLKRLGVLMPYEALRITRQVAGSLGAAHARGIIHRDLKPENIFMVRDSEALGGERAKVLDFGIAKLGDQSRSKTMTGMMIGTPIYMSPEQCRGAGKIDHRTDIYSLGCVLYYLLCGRPPFDGEGMGEIITGHMREPAKPPSTWVQGLPPGIDDLVLACLAKSPDERYQTMPDLQAACDHMLAQITAHGPNMRTVPLAVPLPPGFRSATPGTGSAPVPNPTPAPPSPTPTTLGASAGQSLATAPRRRTGLWVGLGAGLVVGVVVIAAVVAGGKNKDKDVEPATPPTPAQPIAAPTPPTPTPPPPRPPDPPPTQTAATPPPPVVDAGVAAAPPPDAAVKTTSKRPPHGPTVKPPTTKPGDDLYDDR